MWVSIVAQMCMVSYLWPVMCLAKIWQYTGSYLLAHDSGNKSHGKLYMAHDAHDITQCEPIGSAEHCHPKRDDSHNVIWEQSHMNSSQVKTCGVSTNPSRCGEQLPHMIQSLGYLLKGLAENARSPLYTVGPRYIKCPCIRLGRDISSALVYGWAEIYQVPFSTLRPR